MQYRIILLEDIHVGNKTKPVLLKMGLRKLKKILKGKTILFTGDMMDSNPYKINKREMNEHDKNGRTDTSTNTGK